MNEGLCNYFNDELMSRLNTYYIFASVPTWLFYRCREDEEIMQLSDNYSVDDLVNYMYRCGKNIICYGIFAAISYKQPHEIKGFLRKVTNINGRWFREMKKILEERYCE